ncbi:potassium channel family protein [Clostridium sp. LP20]|uniref:potassium channel family protein n=1 Tax=Clostridium sp. LP20 TaxID=3418665 RepID=UPI003EE52314
MRDLEFTENDKFELVYDIGAGIMAIMAVLVVMLQFSNGLNEVEAKIIKIVDSIIYIIFIIDFCIRLFTCKNKQLFFKRNIIDLIAIIPYGLFSSSAYGSAFKLIRIVSYILRLIENIKEVLFTNGFIYALGSTVIITFLGSVGIYIFESGVSETIVDYGDALWWSFVTVTTVGYGDISPTTTGGRFIACILMLAGIGFLSMLTSTISTFFFSAIKRNDNREKDKEAVNNRCILDISDLPKEERINLISYYNFLKNGEP